MFHDDIVFNAEVAQTEPPAASGGGTELRKELCENSVDLSDAFCNSQGERSCSAVTLSGSGSGKEVKPVRRALSKEEKAIRRSRIGTLIVVSLALVVTLFTFVFLRSFVYGATEPAVQMVTAPCLIGQHSGELQAYDGVVIVQQCSAYSDEYAEGIIVRQLPEGGSLVASGTKIFVVVSCGAEPRPFVMENLVDMALDDALHYLQRLDLDLHIEIVHARSEVIRAGYIVSTLPAAGEEFWKGGTITLTVCLGKEVVTAEMPNLLQGAANYKTIAETQMNLRGFKNVEWVAIDCFQPEGKILSQSVPAGALVDVNSPVQIMYSSGQTPVSLVIMPNLLASGGMTKEDAAVHLKLLGLTNVEWVHVNSEAVSGMVVGQSIPAGEMVAADTLVVIEVSK